MAGVKWRLKGCPRCKGDILVEQDSYGKYEWCLQCGCQLDKKGVLRLRLRPETGREMKAILS